MPNIKREQITYAGWAESIRLSNASVELVVPTCIGPRIMHFSLLGKENVLGINSEDQGQSGGQEWRNYGGHRLWHSPEAKPRTYSLDNEPIEVTPIPNGLRLTQADDPLGQIKKEIEFTLDPKAPRVKVVHRLTNQSLWPLTFAAWALSVMATGGVAVIPQAESPFALLPNRTLTLWPYTKMNDPRVTWGERFILLRQDPQKANPFKIGLPVPDGWAAYANKGQVFVKFFSYDPNALYPDWGCVVETYTNNWMLELETLGPLTQVEPGQSITHTEEWLLLEHEVKDETDAAALMAKVAAAREG